MTARFPRRRRRVKKKKRAAAFDATEESPIITRRPMPSRGNPKHEARYDEIPTRDKGGDARTSGSERRFFARVRRYNTFHRLRARGAASHRRLSGRSPGSLALLELDGVHGDVAPDQHDGGARGAEHHGAALGLRGRGRGGKVAGEFSGVERCQKPARRASRFRKRPRVRVEKRGGGRFGRYAPRRCRTSSRRGCTPAAGKEARVGKVSYGRATRDEGNPSKISPANGRAEPREGSGEARARTGSPSPPRLGAEVLKLRTGAVRARCVSARRAALTTALDMLPRAGKECTVKGMTPAASTLCEKNFQVSYTYTVKYRD